MQESEIEVVWTRDETRSRIRRKTDAGDGATWEKKKRKTTVGMVGLCRSMRGIRTRNFFSHACSG